MNFPGVGGGWIPPTPPRSAHDHPFTLEFDTLLPTLICFMTIEVHSLQHSDLLSGLSLCTVNSLCLSVLLCILTIHMEVVDPSPPPPLRLMLDTFTLKYCLQFNLLTWRISVTKMFYYINCKAQNQANSSILKKWRINNRV